MGLTTRLTRLERRQTGQIYDEAALRAVVDARARAEDLPFDELLAETKRLLAMTPVERARVGRELSR
jgi:hypothetical protein